MPETAAASAEQPPWREPVRGGYPDPGFVAMSGIEQLRALRDGRVPLPPLSRLTGNALASVADGETTFTMPLTGWLRSPQGAISIGPLALPADAAVSTAIQTRLPPSSPYSTSELSLRLLSPVRPGGTITARGRVIEARRTLTLSEVALIDDAGRLVGHGSGLCIVQPDAVASGGAAGHPARGDVAGEADGSRAGEAAGPRAGEADGSRAGEADGSRAGAGGADLVVDGPDPDPFAREPGGAVLGPEVWERLAGLEVLRRQLAGELPPAPVQRLFGLRPVSASEGTATFALPATEWLCAPPRGRVQGGCVAMLAEAALMAAVQTRLPAGVALAPVDLKVNFVRPLAADGREAVARGQALHVGRRTAVARSEVLDADERLVAIASGSAMLLAGRPASLAR